MDTQFALSVGKMATQRYLAKFVSEIGDRGAKISRKPAAIQTTPAIKSMYDFAMVVPLEFYSFFLRGTTKSSFIMW
jgi:hypothetical protein